MPPLPKASTRTSIVVYGTGGFGREVHQLIVDLNSSSAAPQWEMLGWLDGDKRKHGTKVHGLPVLGDESWLIENPSVSVAVGVGAPQSKQHVVEAVKAQAHSAFATLIHPSVWVGNAVSIGTGSIVCAGTIITTDISIGDFVTVNLDCTIGHDSVISDFVTLAPSVNVSGSVRVGLGADLGTGSAVIQERSIGRESIIGAGAVVNRDIPDCVTAVGVPAKVIKHH